MSKLIYLSPERRGAPHGPFAGYPGIYERDYCRQVAELEQGHLERCGFRVVIGRQDLTIAQRAREANGMKADLYQTIHTNAGGGTGCECLYYPHPESRRANQCVYDRLTALYPSKRGLRDGKAYVENNQTQMVSVYPEIAFHDHPKDARFLVERQQDIARALAKGVCDYFGVPFLEPEDSADLPEEKPEAGGFYRVQLGAFREEANAQRLAEELNAKGYPAVVRWG